MQVPASRQVQPQVQVAKLCRASSVIITMLRTATIVSALTLAAGHGAVSILKAAPRSARGGRGGGGGGKREQHGKETSCSNPPVLSVAPAQVR
eukprot:SAG25_NODE_1341_length_3256_cov_2.232182_5_plen_93_part_00